MLLTRRIDASAGAVEEVAQDRPANSMSPALAARQLGGFRVHAARVAPRDAVRN